MENKKCSKPPTTINIRDFSAKHVWSTENPGRDAINKTRKCLQKLQVLPPSTKTCASWMVDVSKILEPKI
jgi:hypothetical protein